MKDTPLFVGKNCKAFSEFVTDSEQFDNMVDGRIPALITLKNGVTVAAADKASCGADWGFIEIAVRRSEDKGTTFSKMETAFIPPVRKYPFDRNEYSSAFAIDPLLMETKNGNLIMLFDFYPESKGLHKAKLLEKGSGYEKINGEYCLKLYSGKTKLDGIFARKGKVYTLRSDGFVYSPDGKKTRYYIPQNHSAEYKFSTIGDMYYQVGEKAQFIDEAPPEIPEDKKGKDIYVGNIYLSKGKPEFDEESPKFVKKEKVYDKDGNFLCTETFPAPLRASMISYIFKMESFDGGKTFSQPVDITMGYKKKSDGVFLGVGPGVGVTLKYGKHKGRILAPAYILNKALVLISDDNGETWRRNKGDFCKNIDECQLVEMPDSKVFCFGRPKDGGKIPLSVSDDGGETYRKLPAIEPVVPQCQRSVISLNENFMLPDGFENDGRYIVLSTPTGHSGKDKSRTDGMVFFGRIDEDTVKWIKSYDIKDKEKYSSFGKYDDFYAYSSISQLDDKHIGLLYEAYPSGYMTFVKFEL